jgi:D-lactate dehydrogenase (cytochrome)
MPDQAVTAQADTILPLLERAAGAGGVITGLEAEAYATDIYRRLEMPLAVVRPATVESLQEIVRIACGAGLCLFPRGGGASYTDAYLPTTPNSLIIDTGRLNRILDVNEADATVTVEAGVTWAELKAALDPRGLRTPFVGPFSGFAATIGGSVSQNTISHGSGAHGISAASVLCMDIVLASGKILRTGSSARQHGIAFMRNDGPDLTGLFTGDCGALGIKARITLPLLRQKQAFACASFGFARFEDLAEGMRNAALERLDDSHFALDAALTQGQIARQDTQSLRAAIRSVLTSSPNVFAAGRQLGRMALAGKQALAASSYMLHVILEGVDNQEVRAKRRRLRAILKSGWPIANTVPAIVRGMPFAPLFNTLGPKGERWVPVHGILPHSRVAAFHTALKTLYAAHEAEMRRLGVWAGGMFTTVGSTGFLYEVALYWPGEHTAYHTSVLPAAHLAALPHYAHDENAALLAEQLKQQTIELFAGHGAGHFQIGKVYPYAGALQASALELLRSAKRSLDPGNLMNPGALGL